MKVLVEAKSELQLSQLEIYDQLSLFEDRVNTATRAIKHLNVRKLAINYLSNDQIVKL
jgi:hypothetical protein